MGLITIFSIQLILYRKLTQKHNDVPKEASIRQSKRKDTGFFKGLHPRSAEKHDESG